MKTITRSLYVKIAAIGLALSFGFSAYAAESPREEVAHAFRLLQQANTNYEGHRAKAVSEVEAAGREMNMGLGGEIPEAERQWKSDAQLKEARHLLNDASQKLESRDRDRASQHLQRAIEEIDQALKTR
jgi:hypothetical protein